MKKIICFLLLPYFVTLLIAQTPEFEWVKPFGGNLGSKGNGIAVDNSGNVYTTGSFSGTFDFDPGPDVFNLTAIEFRDIFVSKLDAAGNFLWAKAITGVDFNIGEAITVDDQGNVYLTGHFRLTVDFDPGQGVFELNGSGDFGVADIYVSKLDSEGNFIWAKNMGGSGVERAYSIALDDQGNVYTTGNFSSSTADFDPGPEVFSLMKDANTDSNTFVSKLDNNGNFVWAKKLGRTISGFPKAIAIDSE